MEPLLNFKPTVFTLSFESVFAFGFKLSAFSLYLLAAKFYRIINFPDCSYPSLEILNIYKPGFSCSAGVTVMMPFAGL